MSAPGPGGAGSLREARARYFAENGFGADGGYTRKWVPLKLGPVPFGFPNSEARVRAVRYHDLHHLVTGYGTSWRGEAEIAAWEIASSCAGFWAAWLLNLYALAAGLAIGAGPAVWRAFLRGRHTQNLYRSPWDEALLDVPLAAVRARLGCDRPAAALRARPRDVALFVAACVAGLALWLATVAAGVLLVVAGVRAVAA